MAASKQLARFAEFGKKIVAVGRNYREHAKELGNPVPTEPFVFLKPTTAYITDGERIKTPRNCDNLAYEVELGLVIGSTCKDVPEDEVMGHIGGYVLALDMTNRGLQDKLKKAGLPWSTAKGFDTSCPISAFIPKDRLPEPQDVRLWLKVDTEIKQDGNTRDMIFQIEPLVSWISKHFTLEAGDVILTGTPSGVGPVKPGQTIYCGLGDVMEMAFTVE